MPHASERYTTTTILSAETDLLTAASEPTGTSIEPALVETVLAEVDDSGSLLDDDQRRLARAFCVDDRRIVVGIGPAGSGKTTAMRAAAAVWTQAGRRVVPLAPSAAAASVLGAELGLRAENLHKFCHELARGTDDPFFRLGPGDVVLVDEAGMAGTLRLHAILRHAQATGASVRLVGDPAQLGAVESGGVLRLLANDVGAVTLTGLRRFADPVEAAATLGLRDGNSKALDFYENADRIRSGTRSGLLEDAYAAWRADVAAGRTAVMVAAGNDDVAALSARARVDRIAAGQVEAGGVAVAGGNRAGVGDWVITRRNQRTLALFGGRDFVKNGDTWTVAARYPDGSLDVTHHSNAGRVRLPADYVAEHVELAYATTAHRAQGSTVDVAHALVGEETTRETLYVAATRARLGTTLYVTTDDAFDVDTHVQRVAPRTARQVLEQALSQQGAEKSATETIRDAHAAASRLRAAVAQLAPPNMPPTTRRLSARQPNPQRLP
ncbi:MAG: ATP-dependent DNA helicase, partial [Acidothermaceae bacterium]